MQKLSSALVFLAYGFCAVMVGIILIQDRSLDRDTKIHSDSSSIAIKSVSKKEKNTQLAMQKPKGSYGSVPKKICPPENETSLLVSDNVSPGSNLVKITQDKTTKKDVSDPCTRTTEPEGPIMISDL